MTTRFSRSGDIIGGIKIENGSCIVLACDGRMDGQTQNECI